MEINKLLTKLSPYDQAKVEKAEADKARAKRSKGEAEGSAGDKVSLSSEAKHRTEAYKSAQAAPEIRQEKVDEIKAQIASGTYEIDNYKIAEKLVKEDLELDF